MNDLESGAERADVPARTCSATGVYQSGCGCAVRTAFAVGDPFTACPACEHAVDWSFLSGSET